MRNDKTIVSYAVSLGDVERVNSQFSRVRIRVCYAGKNRHNEVISKETLTRAAENSLRLVPIVGHYLPEVDNFGGHDMALEVEGDELKLRNLTKAYGVVPESANIGWETVLEKDGLTTHEYLTCDGILWTGRYPTECERILDHGMNQSMEFMVDRWGVTADGLDEIVDGEFAALCILGKSEDPEINVEPCYEQASISSYSLNGGVDELMQAYLASLEQQETTEPEKVEEVEAEVDDTPDEAADADTENTDDQPEGVEPVVEEATVAVDEGAEASEIDYAAELEAAQTRVTELQAALDAANEAAAAARQVMADMTAALEELRSYRRGVEETRTREAMREQFADLNGDVEFEALMGDSEALENVASLTEKCYALRGRKMIPKQTNYQFKGIKVPVRAATEDWKSDNYGGIMDAYMRQKN